MTTQSSPAPQARLLVVEDNDTIRETILEAMVQEGFAIDGCSNGRLARELINRERFDLVILDLMLPGMTGLDLCRQLQQQGGHPLILVISARDSETDRVLGLEVGADDYLIKPFGIRELVARCRALLRRRQDHSIAAPKPDAQARELRCGEIVLLPQECRATKGGEELQLSPKEYKLLEFFLERPRRVWSREELIEKIWGYDYIGDTRTVDVHVRWLRQKIEADPSNPQHLITVRGFGYRFDIQGDAPSRDGPG